MGSLQSPIINWQIKRGDSEAGFAEQKILVIAQGNGTATAKALNKDVQPTEYKALLGDGSMAALAYGRIRKYNLANEVDVICLAEPTVSAVKAKGGLKTTGTAVTTSSNVTFKVGDDEYTVEVALIQGETPAQCATKIAAAINLANTNLKYPFTAAVNGTDTSLVDITFKYAGSMGNGLSLTVSNRVAGIGFTVIPFTGGAGVYDVAGVLTGLTDRYQTVIFDDCMTYDLVKDWLESRVNKTNQVVGGVGFSMLTGTITALKTDNATKNAKSMVRFGNPTEMKLNCIPLLAMAEFGAKRALRLTDGAVLGDLVVDAEEAFGGINKSSLPYHNTPMSYDAPVTQIEIEQVMDLYDAGVSLIVPATIGTVVGTVVTTYKTDNTGVVDKTFNYLEAMDTSYAIQEYLFSNCKKEFGQTRATGGDLVDGASMTNEGSVASYICGLYDKMVAMCLAQGGKEAKRAFKQSLSVKLDVASGVYAVLAPTAIVSQFRGLNGVVAISYNFK